MRLPDRKFLALGLIALLASCGGNGRVEQASTPVPTTGPAADYPIVVGEPYAVMGVNYTPVDTLNYDEVGYLGIEPEADPAITGAHHTLPLPSYVEVTSLDSGRTILIRLTRRGPMDSNSLIALSSGAAKQLGVSDTTAVRVRRVNPPEVERAMLRRGEAAPERMETPQSLVTVLRRKLPEAGTAPAVALTPPKPQQEAPVASDAPVSTASAAPESLALPSVDAAPGPDNNPRETPVAHTATTPDGRFVVQAGAFSVEGNAKTVAAQIDGRIDRSGKLYLVRTGPYADKAAAKAALAKVIAAGYSGARIYSLQ